jgi:predicted transcriptional regulator
MPLPAVAWAVFEFVVAAIAVYEAIDVVKDIYEGLDKYSKAIEQAKQELKEAIEKLKGEIDRKIDEKEEMAVLLAATGADPQSPKDVAAACPSSTRRSSRTSLSVRSSRSSAKRRTHCLC